jgi:hypothetical protein
MRSLFNLKLEAKEGGQLDLIEVSYMMIYSSEFKSLVSETLRSHRLGGA